MKDDAVSDILSRLAGCGVEQRREIFQKAFPFHPLEGEFRATAQMILDAIDRGNDFTKRGIRGMIAELEFAKHIDASLANTDWKVHPLEKDYAYDFYIADKNGSVKVQVKMQRLEDSNAMKRGDMYIVEIQKTRGGADRFGKATRPYRFEEFDIIAVCMEPQHKGNWSSFMYTLTRWLIPQRHDSACIQTMQYIPSAPNTDWTDDFLTAVDWLRSPLNKVIDGRITKSRIKDIQQTVDSRSLVDLSHAELSTDASKVKTKKKAVKAPSLFDLEDNNTSAD